jgi:hypothetical protein
MDEEIPRVSMLGTRAGPLYGLGRGGAVSRVPPMEVVVPVTTGPMAPLRDRA